MIGRLYFFLGLFLIAALIVFPSSAHDKGQLPIELILSHQSVSAGGEASFAVIFNVPPGHHITSLENGFFFVEVVPIDGFNFKEPNFPAPKVFQGEFGAEEVYQGSVPVIIDFSAAKDLTPDDYTFNIKYGCQICTETGALVCYLPQTADTTLTVSVVPPGVTPIPTQSGLFKAGTETLESEVADSAESIESRFTTAIEKGSILAFLLVFIAGILSSFTPCVYPVIPITIGYIGSRAEGKRFKGFVLSIFLVLGIATIYSILGLIAAASGSVFGAYSQHPAVLIVISAIFAVMGASMLGAFEITLPASVQGKMRTERKGFLGAYLVGMITGVVAAPCVGPILVALLAWVAQSGSLIVGFLLLFTYAVGMGLLFIVIGTFAGAMTALPGAGKWMETIKKVFGVILIAGAVFILKPALPIGLYLLFWGVLLIITGVFAGALEILSTEALKTSKWRKAIGVIILIAGIVTFIEGYSATFGLDKSSEFSLKAAPQSASLEWIVNDPAEAFQRAADSHKGVIMDFYADWCAACIELDEKTWAHPQLIAHKYSWIYIKMDLTRTTTELAEIQTLHQVRGLPTVIFFNPNGDELTRFSGFKTAGQVLKIIGQL